MVTALCPRCESVVALHEGHPVVGAGAVALWHRTCWDVRDTPIVVARASEPARSARPRTAPIAEPTVRSRWLMRGASTVAAGFFLFAIGFTPSLATSFARADVDELETPSIHAAVTTREQRLMLAWVPTALEARYPMPSDGTPLDQQYPSLRGWIHPVTHSAEHVPTETPRLFGVGRIGIETPRPECGEGHCGIDLDGPRGRALVAVADGNVVRVERSELGADKLSGRYVRIEHDDGTFTAYMHMDDVSDQLEPGTRVRAGQYVGTLGATAVYAAPPHLHFSLEIPAHKGQRHGDSTDTKFIDPAPFLARATIVALPNDLDDVIEKPEPAKSDAPRTKHHAIKPAS